ncbi:DMT family transporter [Caldimonas tepidiphila]|uniref:DMT family transporter n=1 Tax=Caldimonas tepidiphila TaxID=2315841 RepID=UPI000E5C0B7A|nr:DMT family transporter [Caldimonas tepidiphila]
MLMRPRDIGLLVALTLMWGVNWPMMKFSLRELTPLYFRAVTMSGGALLLYLFFRWRGTDMRLPRGSRGAVAWLALPNILGWHLFSILGLAQLASGRAAILGFTMPVWTVLLAVLLTGERLTARVLLSVAAALAAVGLLSAQELARLAGSPVGVVLMQLAALSWAAGTLMMRRTKLAMPTEAVTVWMMAMGAAGFWLAALATEPLPDPRAFSGPMWGSLAYGVLLNYGWAQVIWFGMARRLPPAASAFSIMAVPLVGTLSAAGIVGEVPHALDHAAAACITIAIASALLPVRKKVPS